MLGQFLVGNGTISEAELDAAEARRAAAGGHLSENLLALDLMDPVQIQSLLRRPPQVPLRVEETGLSEQFLMDLVVKALYVAQLQTVPALAALLKLTHGIVDQLLQTLKKQALVENLGASDQKLLLLRYALSERGRERARSALEQSRYVGPAPVSLNELNAQTEKQSVALERVETDRLRNALSALVLPEETVERLGQAICAGQAILLYGPPGNGKSSVAEALGRVFSETVYIPYAFEVGSQVVKVFDPAIHQRIQPQQAREKAVPLAQYHHDPRWVCCRRPVVIAGGELTLAMLDLEMDQGNNYYEAPLQVKAAGGILVIDDFGRQRVQPADLLNRWIVPLEKRVDFLTLNTGQKFQIVFDEIVIFSTNLVPRALMDDALLRRIHYKVQLSPPTAERYTEILRRVAKAHGLELPEEVATLLLEEVYGTKRLPMAAYHPKFLVQQVLAAAKYRGVKPALSSETVLAGVENLLVE